MGSYCYFTVVANQCFIEKSHILQFQSGLVLVTYYAFIIYWLTKYPITPLHKDAVIGGLKRFDHFKRGSLSGSFNVTLSHLRSKGFAVV